MNNEIKEIINQLEIVARKHTIEVCEDGSKIETMPASVVNELRLNNYSAKLLLDYITNLQTIEQQYSAILSENAELENKINNLQKELDYMVKCDEENQQRIIELGEEINKLTAESTEWESKCYDLQKENEKLKEKLQKEKKDFKEANDYCFELKNYKQRNEKAINDLDILIEIIYQQPTENKEDNMWLLDKLSGIKLELQGEDNK